MSNACDAMTRNAMQVEEAVERLLSHARRGTPHAIDRSRVKAAIDLRKLDRAALKAHHGLTHDEPDALVVAVEAYLESGELPALQSALEERKALQARLRANLRRAQGLPPNVIT